MPRPREVTMGKITPEQAHEAAIKLLLKKKKPYKIIAKHEFKLTKHREWMIVYQAPDKKKPDIIMDEIETAEEARTWRRLLERAWAEGHYAAGMR